MTPSTCNSDSLAHEDADADAYAVDANGSCIQKRRKRLSSHEKEKVEMTRRPTGLQLRAKMIKEAENQTDFTLVQCHVIISVTVITP